MKNKFLALVIAIFIFVVFGTASGLAKESKIYDIGLIYDNGKIALLNEIDVRAGYAPDRKIQPDTGYKADLISLNNDILYSFKFDIPNKVCTDSINPETKELSGDCKAADKANFSLIIPYYENGKFINIYNSNGEKVFFASVEHFAETCGDSICQLYETENICPQDCSPVKPGAESAGIPLKLVIAAVAIIIVFIAVYSIMKKRAGNSDNAG